MNEAGDDPHGSRVWEILRAEPEPGTDPNAGRSRANANLPSWDMQAHHFADHHDYKEVGTGPYWPATIRKWIARFKKDRAEYNAECLEWQRTHGTNECDEFYSDWRSYMNDKAT